MVPLVMRFMQLNPRLQIELSFEDHYVDLVEQGIDVAIRMGRLADSALGARYLGINPWVVVAAPDYLERRGVPSSPEELSSHDALTYSTVQGDARWIFSAVGIAALPWYVAYESVSAGAVKPLLEDWKLPSQEIHAVYPSPRLVPTKVIGFIEWLQGQIHESWWSELNR
jgi:DNA-binding transcriptional LysR family regulator